MTIERTPSSFAKFSETVTVTGSGAWVYISGQVGFDETGKAVVSGGISDETNRIFDQIDRRLAEQGGSLSDVIKLNVFMTDLAEYGDFSAVRTERFPDVQPSSSAVGVSDLLLGAKIEIDGVAFIPDEG